MTHCDAQDALVAIGSFGARVDPPSSTQVAATTIVSTATPARSAMNPYNGYTGKEREAKLRAWHQRVNRGFAPCPPGPCSICGDPSAPVEPHSEDYSLPYLWEPPAEYTLCRVCHRHRLHQRFLKPDLWAAHKAHVRRGGYSSDLHQPEIARELHEFRTAWRNGQPLKLRALRPRAVSPDAWWERLTTDRSSLASPAARPRP